MELPLEAEPLLEAELPLPAPAVGEAAGVELAAGEAVAGAELEAVGVDDDDADEVAWPPVDVALLDADCALDAELELAVVLELAVADPADDDWPVADVAAGVEGADAGGVGAGSGAACPAALDVEPVGAGGSVDALGVEGVAVEPAPACCAGTGSAGAAAGVGVAGASDDVGP